MHTITLTSLPNGRIRNPVTHGWHYRWSVYVSIRLDITGADSATLKDFAPFDDWPALLAGADYYVDFMGEQASESESYSVQPQRLAESPLWNILFHPELPVLPYEEPDSDEQHEVLSFDSKTLREDVRDAYVASMMEQDPQRRRARLEARAVRLPDCDARHTLADLVAQWREATPLERFRLFFERTDAEPLNAAEEAAPTDFHKAQSAVADFPGLLTRLGLVLPFEVQADQVEAPTTGLIRTRILFGDAPGIAICTPWTAYETAVPSVEQGTPGCEDLAVFHPRPTSDSGAGRRAPSGFLEFSVDDVALGQEHVVNASLELGQYARHLKATPVGEPGPPLPALFTAGIGLYDRRIEADVKEAVARRQDLEAWLGVAKDAANVTAEEQILYSDDLVKGFRVDVRRGDGPWRSLSERQVDFDVGSKLPVWQERDEGVVTTVATSQTQNKLTVLKVSDALFEWKGWSLVVPRPGKAVDTLGDAQRDETPQDPDFPLQTTTAVPPGSLERRRFGELYAFRCRAVDLAGRSWSLAEADALTGATSAERFVSDPVRCLRYEQVAPPLVTPALPPGYGEDATTLAIGNARLESPHDNKLIGRLYLMPPRCSVEIAESHGRFDDMESAESWHFIAAHQGTAPTDYDVELLARLKLDGKDQIQIPYLADPQAHVVVLLGLPGTEQPFGPIAFPTDGAEVRSLSLTLRAGSDPPQLDKDDITVYLPAGESRAIQLHCIPAAEDLRQFACAELFHRASPSDTYAASVETLSGWLQCGALPLLSPPLELKLVHAVKVPVEPPVFKTPETLRTLDSVTTRLADSDFQVHAASTSRVDLYAEWSDIVDDPASVAWGWRKDNLRGFAVDIPPDADRPLTDPELTRHEYPDTRFHSATYRAVATSRYGEFYPPSDDPRECTVGSKSQAVSVLSTAAPERPQLDYVVPTFRWTTEMGASLAHVTRRRAPGGLRIYMKRPWFSSGNDERLAVILCPSGGRPVHPAVRACITSWGFNPLKQSDLMPPHPLVTDLKDAEHESCEMQVPTAWVSDEIPATDSSIVVASYPVQLEPRRSLVYCDLELDPHQCFFPMVQLALARYQPNALSAAQLSRTVRSEFVQLMPARVLRVEPAGDGYSVRLEGNSYFDPQDETGELQTSLVSVHFESRDVTIADPHLGWRRVTDSVTLPPHKQAAGDVVWQARLPQPGINSQLLRLLVREYALFDTDASATDPQHTRSPERDGRLVFADAIELPGGR